MPYRELHDALLGYKGESAYGDLLLPWIHANQDQLSWLRSFGQRQGEPIPPASVEELWALHALSCVCQVLLLPFQRQDESGQGDAWAGPPVSLAEVVAFLEALGLTVLSPAQFSPFYHEIVRLDPAASPRARPSIVAWSWPCVMLGNMLFLRGGVQVCAGEAIFLPRIADASTLYWANRRRGRPTNDLSDGWGSNSRWRTAFRRDYSVEGSHFYNVDGSSDLAVAGGDTAHPDLTWAERIELLTQRCLVSSNKPHVDLFPYNERWCESAVNEERPGLWSRCLSYFHGADYIDNSK